MDFRGREMRSGRVHPRRIDGRPDGYSFLRAADSAQGQNRLSWYLCFRVTFCLGHGSTLSSARLHLEFLVFDVTSDKPT